MTSSRATKSHGAFLGSSPRRTVDAISLTRTTSWSTWGLLGTIPMTLTPEKQSFAPGKRIPEQIAGSPGGSGLTNSSTPERGPMKTEAGSGGKRGHSNMSHYDHTEIVKKNARKARRAQDKEATREAR